MQLKIITLLLKVRDKVEGVLVYFYSKIFSCLNGFMPWLLQCGMAWFMSDLHCYLSHWGKILKTKTPIYPKYSFKHRYYADFHFIYMCTWFRFMAWKSLEETFFPLSTLQHSQMPSYTAMYKQLYWKYLIWSVICIFKIYIFSIFSKKLTSIISWNSEM